MAQRNMHIPTTKGAPEALQNPLFKRMAEDFDRSPYLQIVYDQKLGRGGGIMDQRSHRGAGCRQHHPGGSRARRTCRKNGK